MDPLLPIYERGAKTGLETKEVVKILLNPNKKLIARAVPASCDVNATFVVDVSAPHVSHFKSILADDLGAWDPNGTKHAYYRAPNQAKPPMKVSENIYNDDNERYVYKVTRSYFRNKSSSELLRIVVYLKGNHLNVNDL